MSFLHFLGCWQWRSLKGTWRMIGNGFFEFQSRASPQHHSEVEFDWIAFSLKAYANIPTFILYSQRRWKVSNLGFFPDRINEMNLKEAGSKLETCWFPQVNRRLSFPPKAWTLSRKLRDYTHSADRHSCPN